MFTVVRAAALIATVAGGALAASSALAAEGKDCRSFRAVGSGFNESIASLMATQGAINLAENRGYTVKGEAKLEGCKSGGTFGTECSATSYACIMPK